MYTFSKLLKTIRNEADLTQPDLAKILDVSSILISMVETGGKEPSKKLVHKLAKALDIHPIAIMPFLAIKEKESFDERSSIEKKLISFGEDLQEKLIKKKAKLLTIEKS